MTVSVEPTARLCVVFARQRRADAYTVDEVATDARRVVTIAIAVRRALQRQRSADKMVLEIQEIADKYGARVVPNFDLEGTVIGMTFQAGGYSSGFRNVFPVT